ncbi:MAG: PDZ domain-containing protein [Nitrospira sp.]
MQIPGFPIAIALIMALSIAGSALAEESSGSPASGLGEHGKLPNGVIGVSLQIGAERIGDAAILYVSRVHPEGPAHQAGLRPGNEVVSVDGTSVTGKSFEQVISMIRGEVGTAMKLGVRAEHGLRELSLTRVTSDILSKGPSESHGNRTP